VQSRRGDGTCLVAELPAGAGKPSARLRPAPAGPGRAVIDGRPRREHVDLGEFGMELPDLMLAPHRRAEPVMGDRRQHEEPGFRRVKAVVQPVSTLHVILPAMTGGA